MSLRKWRLFPLTHIYVSFGQGELLTHWGRATHICVSKLTTIGSDNGLSPGRRQAIMWTIAGILLIGPFGTNFSEIVISIQTFSFKKMHLKVSSVKWRPSCLGLNVLTHWGLSRIFHILQISSIIFFSISWQNKCFTIWHCFRPWLCTRKATSYYLRQWHNSLTFIMRHQPSMSLWRLIDMYPQWQLLHG